MGWRQHPAAGLKHGAQAQHPGRKHTGTVPGNVLAPTCRASMAPRPSGRYTESSMRPTCMNKYGWRQAWIVRGAVLA